MGFYSVILEGERRNLELAIKICFSSIEEIKRITPKSRDHHKEMFESQSHHVYDYWQTTLHIPRPSLFYLLAEGDGFTVMLYYDSIKDLLQR